MPKSFKELKSEMHTNDNNIVNRVNCLIELGVLTDDAALAAIRYRFSSLAKIVDQMLDKLIQTEDDGK